MFDREFHIRFNLADLLKGLCASPVVVVAAYGLICLPWDSNNAPLWVQAIGSVGAILVAVWVTDRGHRHQLEAAKLKALADDSQAAWVCECAFREVVSALGEASDGDLFRMPGIMSSRVQRSGETLRQLLGQRVPHRLVDTVFTAIAEVEGAATDIALLRNSDAIEDYARFFQQRIATMRALQTTCQTEHLRLARLSGTLSDSTQRLGW